MSVKLKVREADFFGCTEAPAGGLWFCMIKENIKNSESELDMSIIDFNMCPEFWCKVTLVCHNITYSLVYYSLKVMPTFFVQLKISRL